MPYLRNLGRNLTSAVRLVLMLRLPHPPFRVTLDQLTTLILIDIAVYIACERMEVSGHVRFWSSGLAFLSAECVAIFFGCYLVARIQGRPATITALAVMLFAVTPIIDLVVMTAAVSVGWHPDDETMPTGWPARIVGVVAILWQLVVLGRIIRLLYRPPAWRLALLVAAIILMLVQPGLLIRKEPLWYDDTPEQAELPRINVENTYARQGRLLSEAMHDIKRHEDGSVSLYFVAFAGWGGQDVFLKEARFARALFDRRFGTEGRSIVLADNPATIKQLPIASVANLDAVLDHLADRMDVEQDILFLFLTSHGSPGQLAVRLGSLQLNDLAPATLRKMLDDAHIKWRVLVISACYSGGFVEALKDAHTLVMTAAAADRTSFGCGSEREFTYFGDAYFNQALQHDTSFIDAFSEAKATIAAREGKEALKASEPQIFVGEEIEKKLRELKNVDMPSSAP